MATRIDLIEILSQISFSADSMKSKIISNVNMDKKLNEFPLSRRHEFEPLNNIGKESNFNQAMQEYEILIDFTKELERFIKTNTGEPKPDKKSATEVYGLPVRSIFSLK